MSKNVKKSHYKIKIKNIKEVENKIDNINSNAEKERTNEEIKMGKEENPKRKTKKNVIIEKKIDNIKLQTELNNKNEEILEEKEDNINNKDEKNSKNEEIIEQKGADNLNQKKKKIKKMQLKRNKTDKIDPQIENKKRNEEIIDLKINNNINPQKKNRKNEENEEKITQKMFNINVKDEKRDNKNIKDEKNRQNKEIIEEKEDNLNHKKKKIINKKKKRNNTEYYIKPVIDKEEIINQKMVNKNPKIELNSKKEEIFDQKKDNINNKDKGEKNRKNEKIIEEKGDNLNNNKMKNIKKKLKRNKTDLNLKNDNEEIKEIELKIKNNEKIKNEKDNIKLQTENEEKGDNLNPKKKKIIKKKLKKNNTDNINPKNEENKKNGKISEKKEEENIEHINSEKKKNKKNEEIKKYNEDNGNPKIEENKKRDEIIEPKIDKENFESEINKENEEIIEQKGEKKIIKKINPMNPKRVIKKRAPSVQIVKTINNKRKNKLYKKLDIGSFFPNKSDNKISTAGLIGLMNIGAICYMNATLQCFSNIPKLREYLTEKKMFNKLKKYKSNHKLSFALAEVLTNLWVNLDKRFYPPENFKNVISEMNPFFKGIAANDPNDLILFLLENIHKELNIHKSNKNSNNNFPINSNNFFEEYNNIKESYINQNKSIIVEEFYGYNYNITTCNNCQSTYNNIQVYNILIFPLEEIRKYKNYNDNNVKIIDCFEYYTKIGLNQNYYCNFCKQNYPSNSQTKLLNTPHTLIINLNRGKGLEYNVNIIFDEYLNLNKYINNENSPYYYELIGVICHFGSNDMGGHFVAFCKNYNNCEWYKYNDQMVTKCLFNEVRQNGIPYALFYNYVQT